MMMQKNPFDCLQCCLSNLLGIPYEEIPKFYELYNEDTNTFMREYDSWLKSKGYIRVYAEAEYIQKSECIEIPHISLSKYRCIATLKKMDRFYSHAVVLEVENGILNILDPREKSEYGIEDLDSVEFIIPFSGESLLS